jgi:hypothetical protein
MDELQTAQDAVKMLDSMGLPTSAAFLVGATIFNIIGLFAWLYGRKTSRPAMKWIGVALIVYPLFVWQTTMMYVIGCLLCIALYIYRE